MKRFVIFMPCLALGLYCLAGCVDTIAGQTRKTASSGQAGDSNSISSVDANSAPVGEKIEIQIAFNSAVYNDDPDADLSRLLFQVTAKKSGDCIKDSVELSSLDEPVKATVDLGLCILDVYPEILRAHESGRSEYTYHGGYKFTIRDHADRVMGYFQVTESGALKQGRMPDKAYSSTFAYRNEAGSHSRFNVLCSDGNGRGGGEKVLAIEFESEIPPLRQEANTPNRSRFIYIFPRGDMTIYPPEAIEQQE